MNDAKAALERSVALWKDLEPGNIFPLPVTPRSKVFTHPHRPGSPTVPPYATRMATTRLLMETEMYDTAFEVLEGLQEEDDQVVDLWYLGGWCLYCKGDQLREEEAAAAAANLTGKGKGKGKEVSKDDDDNDEEKDDDWQTLWEASREWLNNCAQVSFVLCYGPGMERSYGIANGVVVSCTKRWSGRMIGCGTMRWSFWGISLRCWGRKWRVMVVMMMMITRMGRRKVELDRWVGRGKSGRMRIVMRR